LDEDIHVLRPGRNLGYAGGNNLGIEYALAAGASYVLVLNSDAFPLPGSLEQLVNGIDRAPNVAACGAALIRWISDGTVEVNSGTAFDWRTGRTRPQAMMNGPGTVDFACGAMVAYRREALEAVGLLDSNLFLFYEEIDWSERAREAGFVVMVDPLACAMHLGSVSVARAPKATAFYTARNRMWILRRYASRHGSRVRVLPHLMYSFKGIAGHLAHGRIGLVRPAAWGTAAGLFRDPGPDSDPMSAARQARFEAAE
jgi:GT2 family glycosyltransferase